jgi:hypothetical protein
LSVQKIPKQLFACILALMMCVTTVFSQGFFQSAADIELVQNPENNAHKSFLYRAKNEVGYSFYKVELNSLLYQSKKVYIWPRGLSELEKYSQPLFASASLAQSGTQINEVIFNKELLLVETDSLYLVKDGVPFALLQLENPGVLYLHSRDSTWFTPMQSATMVNTSNSNTSTNIVLPVFHYTKKGSAKFAIVHRPGHYSAMIDITIPKGLYEKRQINLQSVPDLMLPRRELNLNMARFSTDKQKLDALDSMSEYVQQSYKQDSMEVEAYKVILWERMGKAPGQIHSESNEEYQARAAQWDQEKSRVIQEIFAQKNIQVALTQLRQKLDVLQTYRDDITAAKEKEDRLLSYDPRSSLLNEYLWGRFFIGSNATFARNLAPEATDLGPSKMRGLHGYLNYYMPLGAMFGVIPRLQGYYGEWFYNSNIKTLSTQKWIGGSVFLSVPLAVAAHGLKLPPKGTIILFRIGVTGGYSQTVVYGDSSEVGAGGFYEPKEYAQPSIGGTVAFDLFVSPLPLGLSLEYTYDTRKYGDIHAGISIPLWFIKPLQSVDSDVLKPEVNK